MNQNQLSQPQPDIESLIPATPAERMFPNPHMKTVEGNVDLLPEVEKPYLNALNVEAKALASGADPNTLPLYNTSLTARREALGRITDPLTGLLNREGVTEWFERNKPEKFGIFFADGDEFGQINKVYGHKVGDEVINFIGENVASKLRTGNKPTEGNEDKLKLRANPAEHDIVGIIDAGVGRVGGDEFVFIVDMSEVEDGKEQEVLDLISSRINQASEYTASNGKKVEVRISAAGMVGHASDARSVESYKEELDKQLQPEKKGRKAAREVIKAVKLDLQEVASKN